MAAFAAQFIAEVQAQRGHFRAIFSSEASSPFEERLAESVAVNWHPLPAASEGAGPTGLPGERAAGGSRGIFAIDGSEAMRNFSNASWLLICQALLLGPGTDAPSLQVRLVPGNVPGPVVDSYASRLMRWLELRLALDHLGRLAGGALVLDGSLYSILPHLLYPLERLHGQPGCSDDADLPIRILEAYLDLLDACRKQDVLLLGVSKTTQDRVLTHTLAHLPADLETISVDMAEQIEAASEPLGSRIPPDAEALARWANGPGFSTPVLLGLYSFGRFRETLLSEPAQVAEGFARCSRYPRSRLDEIVERLRSAPAIAAFHVRLADGDDCLRVDLPAYALGRSDGLLDLFSGLVPATAPLGPSLNLLRACYGGPNVYNAPLYAVDKQVRLSNDMVDGPLLSILRSAIRPDIRYNRSARRFL